MKQLHCISLMTISGPLSGVLILYFSKFAHSFQPHPLSTRAVLRWTHLSSSIGDGQPPSNDGDKDDNPWGDFLDPSKEESENLRNAREFFSEASLPISFGAEEDATAADAGMTDESYGNEDLAGELALMSDSEQLLPGAPTPAQLANNPYIAVVTSLSPSDLISKFTSTTHPRVQAAVRSTILSLIGSLPKMAFDTTVVTTGKRLASLMFQLQMTGYMFKNAEYKLSMSQALVDNDKGKFLLAGANDEPDIDPLQGKLRGKVRVKYVKTSSGGSDVKEEKEDASGEGGIEVDAEAYMSELRSEVMQLRDELALTNKQQEEALRKDLLAYIRTLPEKELKSLTSTMSDDVLVAMKGLVNAVISGIGEDHISASTITEQSGEGMAQLCLWQLAIGYNLRTLEVREEMKKQLTGSTGVANNSEGEGGILDEPDTLQ